MFRQRLRGGHRINNQSSQNFHQVTSQQKQNDWNNPSSKESSPGTWDADSSDSAWNWDVVNSNNEANSSDSSFGTHHQQTPLSQGYPSESSRSSQAPTYAPPDQKTKEPPFSFASTASPIHNPATSFHSAKSKIPQSFSSPSSHSNPHILNQSSVSGFTPENVQFQQSHLNQYTNHIASNFQPNSQSNSVSVSHQSQQSFINGNLQVNQEAENWGDWGSWDDWNGSSATNNNDQLSSTLPYSNLTYQVSSTQHQSVTSYASPFSSNNLASNNSYQVPNTGQELSHIPINSSADINHCLSDLSSVNQIQQTLPDVLSRASFESNPVEINESKQEQSFSDNYNNSDLISNETNQHSYSSQLHHQAVVGFESNQSPSILDEKKSECESGMDHLKSNKNEENKDTHEILSFDNFQEAQVITQVSSHEQNNQIPIPDLYQDQAYEGEKELSKRDDENDWGWDKEDWDGNIESDGVKDDTTTDDQLVGTSAAIDGEISPVPLKEELTESLAHSLEKLNLNAKHISFEEPEINSTSQTSESNLQHPSMLHQKESNDGSQQCYKSLVPFTEAVLGNDIQANYNESQSRVSLSEEPAEVYQSNISPEDAVAINEGREHLEGTGNDDQWENYESNSIDVADRKHTDISRASQDRSITMPSTEPYFFEKETSALPESNPLVEVTMTNKVKEETISEMQFAEASVNERADFFTDPKEKFSFSNSEHDKSKIEPPLSETIPDFDQKPTPTSESSIQDFSLKNTPIEETSIEDSAKEILPHIHPTSKPPKFSPTGAVPELRARRGSPFQPFGKIPKNDKSDASSTKLHDSELAENPLLSEAQMPELPVKLSVAAAQLEKMKGDSAKEGLAINNVPLVVPELFKNDENDEIEDALSVHVPPDAHCSSKKPDQPHPKVLFLENLPLNNSPGALDLSKASFKDKPSSALLEPSFSRMVPGESTKGESSSQNAYQVPASIPAMPTGRVVTGNDNPQPVLTRIKQEPSEVRSPPDGPDTEPLSDPTPSVIPPVRSETIGSEEPSARMFPPMKDSRAEKISDSRRERTSWDRDSHGNGYYGDRYRERTKESRDYYRDESPHSKWSYDRDYDRRHRKYDSEEDEDEMHYAEASRNRRNRAYRDELDRYGDMHDRGEREKYPRREKRKNYDKHRSYHYAHEDDDRYYYDRSQPTSRSSSYTNLDTEASHNSHSVRNRDDFYERPHRSMDREPHYRDVRHDRKDPRDPYFRGYPPYSDHYRSRDLYDPQSYYYYYQKYLEHPYYREYYRQYYERYGYAGGNSLADDKTSTRSGRSSVNDELKKSSLSSHLLQDFHDSSFLGGFGGPEYKPSPIYPESSSLSHMKHYGSGEISGVASLTDEGLSEVPQRMTPPLFGVLHSSVSFTPCGKLVQVLPHDPREGEKPLVQITDLQKILFQDKEYALKIEKMTAYPGPLTKLDTHKDIVIQFCEGKAIEASRNPNLPDKESAVLLWHYLSLLVKQNGKVCGADLANLLRRKDASTSGNTSDAQTAEVVRTDSDGSDATNASQPFQSAQLPPPRDEAPLIRQFKDYISIGRTKEAIEFAVREGLWVYAVAVASKMDTVTQTRVMSAIDSCIPSSDVIQTLMQHLSGKRPDVTKSYSCDRWGDWRQHLSVMVANPTGHPDRDQASIIALGDTLASKGQFYAAHLCYLAGEAEWGSFSKKESKLVLLGSSHHQSFKAFATEDAIHCTEIFEYAKSLDSSSETMNTFQSYKLIYAIKLAECGFPAKALKYCEVISSSVAKNPSSFHLEFVSKVYDLATQLKYHDVHYQMGQGEITEMADPEWLQTLYQALYTLQYWASQQQQLHQEQLSQQPEENGDHGNQGPSVGEQSAYHEERLVNPATQPNNYDHTLNQITPEIQTPITTYPLTAGVSNQPNEEVPNFDAQPAEIPTMAVESSIAPPMYAPPTQNDTRTNQFMEITPMNSPTPEMAPNDPSNFNTQSGMAGYMGHSQMPAPQHSLQGPPHEMPQSLLPPNPAYPPSPILDDHDGRDRGREQDFDSDSKVAPPAEENSIPSQANETKDDATEGKDKKQPGFLSRFFGWRESNQAKLPDDKNPSIVWDADKKRWVNKDGDEDEDSAPPPPPVAAAVASNPAAFRGGPKKSRYVDPVSEKDRAKLSAPLMPPHPSSTPPAPLNQGGGDFSTQNLMPANSGPMGGGGEPMPEGAPSQWPNQHPYGNSPLEDPQNDGEGGGGHVPLMGAPGANNFQPMLYNPGQFQQASAPSSQPKRQFQTRRANYNPNQR